MQSLITVTDAYEAETILRSSPDIVDIKNPAEGSLGAPDISTIKKVMNAVPSHTDVSVPIGDVPYLPGTVALTALGAAALGPEYIKIGMRGIHNTSQAENLLKPVLNALEGYSKITVVAALYADYGRAGTLDPMELPEIADKLGIKVCLIDTAFKEGNSLLDILSRNYLGEFTERCHSYGIRVGLAGSLDINHLPDIADTGADYVGVRGGICKNKNRKGSIDPALASEFTSSVRKL